MFEYSTEPVPLNTTVRVMLAIWCVLLVPWLLLAGIAGVAFDGGPSASAYVLVWSIYTYPILLGIAFHFRRRKPNLVWLPMLTFVAVLASAILDDLTLRSH